MYLRIYIRVYVDMSIHRQISAVLQAGLGYVPCVCFLAFGHGPCFPHMRGVEV